MIKKKNNLIACDKCCRQKLGGVVTARVEGRVFIWSVGEGFSEEAHWNRRPEGTSRQAQQGRKEREGVKLEQLWI